MATESPEDDSKFDSDAWRDIVALAARIGDTRSTDQVLGGKLAMQLARSILSLEESEPPGQTHLEEPQLTSQTRLRAM